MSSTKNSSKRSLVIVCGVLAAIGISLFAYLMFYTAPEEVLERVTIVAVTDEGCIAETMDGFPVNIGECNAEVGESILWLVDQKTKERMELMNPTN